MFTPCWLVQVPLRSGFHYRTKWSVFSKSPTRPLKTNGIEFYPDTSKKSNWEDLSWTTFVFWKSQSEEFPNCKGGTCGPQKAPTFLDWSPSESWALAPWYTDLVSCHVELERSMATSSKLLSGLLSLETLRDLAWLGPEPSLRWSGSQSPASFSSFPGFLIIPEDFLCIPCKKEKERGGGGDRYL